MFRRLAFVASYVLLVLALSATAFAAPGGNPGKPGGGNGGGDSTITLDQPQPVYYGDVITFSVTTTKTDRPFVLLECYKGGALVYSSTVGLFQDWYDEWGIPDFQLESLAWNNGDANCTATAQYQDSKYKMRTLATMQLTVFGT